MIAGFVSLVAIGGTNPSLGQSGQRPGEGAEQVTLQIVVEPARPQENRGHVTIGEMIKDELLNPSTAWELGKTIRETVTVVRQKVGNEIQVAAEQFTAIRAKLVRLGLSEAQAERTLEAMNRNLRRTSSWGKPSAVFVVNRAAGILTNYWIKNFTQSAPASSDRVQAPIRIDDIGR
jgi:hypothetical protein